MQGFPWTEQFLTVTTLQLAGYFMCAQMIHHSESVISVIFTLPAAKGPGTMNSVTMNFPVMHHVESCWTLFTIVRLCLRMTHLHMSIKAFLSLWVKGTQLTDHDTHVSNWLSAFAPLALCRPCIQLVQFRIVLWSLRKVQQGTVISFWFLKVTTNNPIWHQYVGRCSTETIHSWWPHTIWPRSFHHSCAATVKHIWSSNHDNKAALYPTAVGKKAPKTSRRDSGAAFQCGTKPVSRRILSMSWTHLMTDQIYSTRTAVDLQTGDLVMIHRPERGIDHFKENSFTPMDRTHKNNIVSQFK